MPGDGGLYGRPVEHAALYNAQALMGGVKRRGIARKRGNLVAPRERKYEQAGAASAAATGKLENKPQAEKA